MRKHREFEVEQSKDETIRFRMQPRNAERLKAECFDRGVSISEFVRQTLKLRDYFDYVDILIHEKAVILPLLEKLSKNF